MNLEKNIKINLKEKYNHPHEVREQEKALWIAAVLK